MIGAVLGWKFDNYPGIMTKEDIITQWPAELGPVPSKETLATWQVDYIADLEAKFQGKKDEEERTAKAIKDIQDAIAIEEPDVTKWKIGDVVTRIKAIETILQIRRDYGTIGIGSVKAEVK